MPSRPAAKSTHTSRKSPAPKPAAKSPRPTSYERTAPKFEAAALASREGRKKAVSLLRALRRREAVDDARWLDRCLGLVAAPPPGAEPIERRDLLAEALSTVVHLNDPSAATRLLEMLAEDATDTPRAMLVAAIGKIGDRAAVPAMLSWFNGLTKRESDPVYREVADALIRLADARVVELVERALSRDAKNDYQRWAYEKALASIMEGRAPSHSLWLR